MLTLTQADHLLASTEGGYGFDETPVGDEGDYTRRDVPMSAARHAALAVCADMNIRFNIGEQVEEGEARNELVDELTEIILKASGPGPFDINVALELNKTHRVAELDKLDYCVSLDNGILETRVNNDIDKVVTSIPLEEVTSDSLFSALATNLALFNTKSPK